ncbi:amylo-alpha-1,6-glucosidase, partial [Candidatus Hydrogenedentota bacterium]
EMKGKELEVGIGEKPFYTPTNGQLPFTITIDSFIFGPLIDPHIIPLAIHDLYLKKGSLDLIKKTLPAFIKYDTYLSENRDNNGDDLINIIHQGESGWDNSKRWMLNSILKYVSCPVQRDKKFMQPPDFNTYFYLSRLAVAKFAELAGDDEMASGFRKRAAKTKTAIQTMWNEETGLYHDRYEEGRVPTDIKSFGGIIPMLGGIPSKEQAERLVANLTDPRLFWSEYPATSLNMDDPQFNAEDEYQSYWNGRVWPNMNWILIEGLIRYGYHDIAADLMMKTLEMMVASGEPTCRENYRPFYENGGHYRSQGHNTFNYGWGGIGADIMIHRIMGLQGVAPHDAIYLDPYFPKEWTFGSIDNVKIGDHEVKLDIRRSGNELQCELVHSGANPLNLVHNQDEDTVHNGVMRFAIEDGKHLDFHWLSLLD